MRHPNPTRRCIKPVTDMGFAEYAKSRMTTSAVSHISGSRGGGAQPGGCRLRPRLKPPGAAARCPAVCMTFIPNTLTLAPKLKNHLSIELGKIIISTRVCVLLTIPAECDR